MKKSILLVVFIAVTLIAGSVFGQLVKKEQLEKKNYGLLFPTLSDGIHENISIPLSSEEAKHLMKNPGDVKNYLHKIAGIVDTLKIPLPEVSGQPYFGGSDGDSMAVFFSPGAGCKILKVGFNVGYNGNDATVPLCDGVNVSLHFVNYDGEAEPGGASSYLLGEWVDNVWTPADWYAANYSGTPVGSLFWGPFPGTVIAEPADAWEEVDMSWIGEADCFGNDFVVMFTPYGGDATAALGWEDDQNWNPPAPYRLWKFYAPTYDVEANRNKWFCRLQVSFACYCIVEFYENTSPALTPQGGPWGSVLTSDARTLECSAVDIDASNEANAGVTEANIVFKVNEGDWQKAPMSLAEGTETDGLWKGDIPAGVMTPGDLLTFYFEMTDGGGLTGKSFEYSYGYFAKTADLLVFWNDNTFSSSFIMPYYSNIWIGDNGNPYMFDVWDGVVDGVLSSKLVDMYDHVVQLDGYSPVTMNDDVLGAWFAAGGKNFFLSSQEWGYSLTGGVDSTFAADDWHNMYLGVETIGPHDINANYQESFPINPVAGDPISGELATFLGDSLQLYNSSAYELGWNDWCDAFTASAGAVVCLTDSAEGRTMGAHKEEGGNKAVFITVDPLALDTGPPNYAYWTEPNEASLVAASLKWFQTPTSVDNNIESGIVTDYSLKQNYPNPFNPETKINYSIAKAGLVTLSVYNVLGQKVAELVNKQQAAGTYHVTWNASDLSSGVYFYRLDAGDYTRTLKMMLLR